MTTTAAHPAQTERPFSAALEHTPLGPGEFAAELTDAWLVGGGRVHGGVMLAVATRAALAGLAQQAGDEVGSDPLAVSGEFLRAPVPGPVHIRTEVVKTGRTASVVRASMTQDDRLTLTATVTAGRLPTEAPVWSDLPDLPAEPPPDVLAMRHGDQVPPIARSSRLLLDPATLRNPDHREPVLRGWVRPVGEEPDVYFALFTADALVPAPVNVGLPGWAPTVQLTALLRAAPAPGWLRTEIRSTSIGGGWFDEDATVIDAEGRLVCQSRQLALIPRR
jgi:acyl-coenzyme A thioesterase PaaI-like protein